MKVNVVPDGHVIAAFVIIMVSEANRLDTAFNQLQAVPAGIFFKVTEFKVVPMTPAAIALLIPTCGLVKFEPLVIVPYTKLTVLEVWFNRT